MLAGVHPPAVLEICSFKITVDNSFHQYFVEETIRKEVKDTANLTNVMDIGFFLEAASMRYYGMYDMLVPLTCAYSWNVSYIWYNAIIGSRHTSETRSSVTYRLRCHGPSLSNATKNHSESWMILMLSVWKRKLICSYSLASNELLRTVCKHHISLLNI